MVYLHLTCFRGLSSLNHFSLLTARRQLLQNSHYQSCQELEDTDAAENIFGDHYSTSVVSPARILCLCFLFLFVVFQQQKTCFRSCGASVVEMLFKFSSVLCFSKYHDCKRRTEVLVLFLVFSEDMSYLKLFIYSSVYVTIDPGISSVVAPPPCLVELLLATFCAAFTVYFFVFSFLRAKEVFYAIPRACSSAKSKEEPPAHFKKKA